MLLLTACHVSQVQVSHGQSYQPRPLLLLTARCVLHGPQHQTLLLLRAGSGCRGSKTKPILPLTEAGPAILEPQERDWDILLTAETHNFPCAVAPYPGLLLQPLLQVVVVHTWGANRSPLFRHLTY